MITQAKITNTWLVQALRVWGFSDSRVRQIIHQYGKLLLVDVLPIGYLKIKLVLKCIPLKVIHSTSIFRNLFVPILRRAA